MSAPLAPVDAVLRAAAKARSLRGRTVVVKLGGSAMEEPAATRGTLECVAAFHTLGVRVVLVHGGGKPIDRAMAAAGVEPVKVQGRRYTDEKSLGIVVRVLHELNRGVAAQIEQFGAAAAAHTDAATFPLTGERLTLRDHDLRPIDLGRVGKVTAVRPFGPDAVVPVLPSLARDADGGWLNVNADTVAAAVAGETGAVAALFLTDTPGVLFDRHDLNSRFGRLTERQCRDLISSGVIQGGMIPKVEACLDALDAGAEAAVILDGRDPHSLLRWLLGEPAGTEFTR